MRTSVRSRKSVLAMSLARKIEKGSSTASRRELSVSLDCSRRKQGCSISDAAKRMASQRRPGPNSRDSSAVGLMAKLKRMRTTRMKTTVVVRSSRERNSVRSSLPRSVAVLERRRTAISGTPKCENGMQGRAGIGVGNDGAGVKLNGTCGESGDFGFAVEAHDDSAAGVVDLR